MGKIFVEYVARTRIEKARLFFLDPTRRVSEVAFDVGFQSLLQFNRTFKKIGSSSSAHDGMMAKFEFEIVQIAESARLVNHS